ncbi:MAG TPA: ATP synthase F1 subunit epsilon, partial [Thermoanaerobaculia bacterium]|nr:ATP synthase F1 subunit epsilon [Thermoanaerobaculia bacterium]
TPTRTVVAAEADSVELPGELGYLGILPGHTPLITVLKAGVLTYRNGGDEHSLAIAAGFAEIANDAVTVLADQAEGPGEVDVAAAERERSGAEEELKTASRESLDEIRARLELAQARLAIAKRGR